MSEIQVASSVGEVVARYPSTMRMFEAMGIDYCCGGKRTLAEAAQEAKMPVETLLAVLRTTIQQAQQAQQEAPERDWQTAPLQELMDYVVETHHSYLYRELPRISELFERVLRAHGARHGDMLTPLSETFRNLRNELEAHLKDEEERIFPMVQRALSGTPEPGLPAALQGLEHEHDAAGEALARMREITQGYQAQEDACRTFCALYEALQELERDLHQHVHLENNILFPRL